MAHWLGPLMVQLPASVGPADCAFVDALLEQLPGAYRYVVEARHPQLFAQPRAWLAMLAARGCAGHSRQPADPW